MWHCLLPLLPSVAPPQVGWSVGQLVGWLVGFIVGRLFSRLVSWLISLMSVNQSVAGSLQKCFPQRSTWQDTTREGRGHGELSSLS